MAMISHTLLPLSFNYITNTILPLPPRSGWLISRRYFRLISRHRSLAATPRPLRYRILLLAFAVS